MDMYLKLNELHHKNFDTLMLYLAEYNPQPYGKEFVGDPEYKELTKSFLKEKNDARKVNKKVGVL
jgi:hypothetical protein